MRLQVLICAMQTKSLLARSAGPAIAAVLALGSTPLLAQDGATPSAASPATAQPVFQLPVDPAPVPQTEGPVIALPQSGEAADSPTIETTAKPAASTALPVVQQVPAIQAEPQAAEPATASSGADNAMAPASQPRRTAPAAADAVEAEPAATAAMEIAATETAAGEVDPATAPAAIAPMAQPLADSAPVASGVAPVDAVDGMMDTGIVAGLLSALALLGLGAIGIVALRRRQTVDAVPLIERPPVIPRVAPAMARENGSAGTVNSTIAAGASALVASEVSPRSKGTPVAPTVSHHRDIREWAQPEPVRRDAPQHGLEESEKGVATAGAAVALPLEAPDTPAARHALLERMVAARPDRANPFHSRKARRHRARLILQSMGRKFRSGRSLIDLSQYPAIWPSLANARPAHA